MKKFLLLFLFLCTSCKNMPMQKKSRSVVLLPNDSVSSSSIPDPKLLPAPLYPWEKNREYLAPIALHHLCCQGYQYKGARKIIEGEEAVTVYDCFGGELPEEQEILNTLAGELTRLQTLWQKKVVVTSGYRCPEHVRYCRACGANLLEETAAGRSITFFLENSDLSQIKNIPTAYTKIDNHTWKSDRFTLKLIAPYSQNDPDNIHPYPYFILFYTNSC